MRRTFENDRGRTWVCLYAEVGDDEYAERYPLRGTRFTDEECAAMTAVLAGSAGVFVRGPVEVDRVYVSCDGLMKREHRHEVVDSASETEPDRQDVVPEVATAFYNSFTQQWSWHWWEISIIPDDESARVERVR